jgi:iron(III) transport system permease protein
MGNIPPDDNGAAAVGVVMTAVMTVFIVIQRRVIAAREYQTVSGKGFRPRRIALGWRKWPALGVVLLFALFAVLLPILALANDAFRSNDYIPDTAHIVEPSLMGLSHFRVVISDPSFQLALRNSLITGIGAAVLGGILHFTMSYAAYRSRQRGRGILEVFAMIPLAVPALVLGLGIFWASLRFSVGLYGTLFIFVLAFIVQFMPQGFRSASASMLQVHAELEESARVSGASRARAIAEIVVPLMKSGIFSTMLLLFILSVGEVSAAIFLFTSNTIVTSVNLYNLWSDGMVAEAAALSLIFSGFLLVIVLATRRWLSTTDSI